jgi:hypothetical protein
MTLVEPLPKTLASDRGSGPDDRRTRRHVVRDYPAVTMPDKTFSSAI